MKDRKIVLVVVLALLASSMMFGWRGCGGLVKLGLHSSRHLSASDDASVSVLAALNDGSAFDADYIHYLESLTPEQLFQYRESYAASLPKLKAMAAPDAKFYFLQGTEFGVPPSYQMLVPMEHETAEHPSLFQFPAGAEKQAYLVARVRGKEGETIHIAMLLWEIDGVWRPIVLSFYPAILQGLSAEHLLTRADVAHEAGQDLLALAHCSLARAYAPALPHRVSGIQHQIKAMGESVGARLGLGQGPLFSLTVDGGQVDVGNLDGLYQPEGFFVVLHCRVPKLDTKEVMKARQKRIAAAFRAAFPEFEKDFFGIGVGEASDDPADEGKGYRSLHPFTE